MKKRLFLILFFIGAFFINDSELKAEKLTCTYQKTIDGNVYNVQFFVDSNEGVENLIVFSDSTGIEFEAKLNGKIKINNSTTIDLKINSKNFNKFAKIVDVTDDISGPYRCMDPNKINFYKKSDKKYIMDLYEEGEKNNSNGFLYISTDISGDISIDINQEEMSCEQILGGTSDNPSNAQLFVRLFIIAIRIGAPILLIILTSSDFMRAIGMQDDDAMIKMWKKFSTRAIVTTIIMLLPTIINLIGKLFNLYDSCGIW